MTREKKVALLIVGFPVGLFLLSGLRAVQVAIQSEVPAEFRDLDCDGRVSPIEWLRGGVDFRLRPSATAPGCQDVVHAKSGRTLVVRCPVEPRCRTVRAPAAAP